MKLEQNNLIIVLFVLLFANSNYSFSANPLVYGGGKYYFQQTTGSDTVNIHWEYFPEAKNRLTVVRPNETFTFEHDSLFATISLHYQSTDGISNYSATRIGNTIQFQGKFKGEYIDKSVDIDEKPWFQSIPFCLGHAIISNRVTQSIDFWVYRPDQFSSVKLEAERDETVKSDHNTDMIVHPTGLFSHFWHGRYRFRSDGLFVEYIGVNGLPGTPETVIKNIEKPR